MKKILLFTLAAASLSACGGLLSAKKAPDEMAVIAGPSLALPPNFELRPPVDASDYHKQLEESRARQIITGSPADVTTPTSGPDAWLVKKVGGDTRDPDIRKRLEVDHKEEVIEKKKGWFTRQKDIFLGEKEKEKAKEEE